MLNILGIQIARILVTKPSKMFILMQTHVVRGGPIAFLDSITAESPNFMNRKRDSTAHSQ